MRVAHSHGSSLGGGRSGYVFTFKNSHDGIHRTLPLARNRCVSRSGKGRCTRMTGLHTPKCDDHTDAEDGVRVMRSTIPGAGMGLFATRAFKKGERIGKYTGEVLTLEDVVRRYGSDRATAPYVVQASPSVFIDAAAHRPAVAYVNHNRDECNCEYISAHRGGNALVSRFGVDVLATRDIEPGEELFANYGSQYRINEPGVSHSTCVVVSNDL